MRYAAAVAPLHLWANEQYRTVRIQSSFSDYYDSAQASGADQTRVFVREARQQVFEQSATPAPWGGQLPPGPAQAVELPGGASVSVGTLHVLFAGKVYRAVRVRRYAGAAPRESCRAVRAHDLFSDREAASEEVFYDEAATVQYLQASAPEVRLDQRGLFIDMGGHFSRRSLRQEISAFLAQQGTHELAIWAAQARVAIAVKEPPARRGARRVTVTFDAALRPLAFYRVLGPWEAYQELQMFWGGVLACEARPMAQVGDRDRAAKHGFDELSFRKGPTKVHRS